MRRRSRAQAAPTRARRRRERPGQTLGQAPTRRSGGERGLVDSSLLDVLLGGAEEEEADEEEADEEEPFNTALLSARRVGIVRS